MTIGLAIMVKTPGHSALKTRLAADCGAPWAIAWYQRAAACVAAVVKDCAHSGQHITPYWAVAESEAAAHRQWSGFATLNQGDGDLGTRMAHVHHHLVQKHGAGILIGADAPQLCGNWLDQACAWLAQPSARQVIGPASDGGFWLYGGNRMAPASLWQSVVYSQADTATHFRKALAAQGEWLSLPNLTDVDTIADLAAMRAEMQRLPAALPQQCELVHWTQHSREVSA